MHSLGKMKLENEINLLRFFFEKVHFFRSLYRSFRKAKERLQGFSKKDTVEIYDHISENFHILFSRARFTTHTRNPIEIQRQPLEINFSRHAKRRARLYKIPETMVERILLESNLVIGTHELVTDIPEFKYPLKIVVSVEADRMTVITNYPLKKGRIP